MDKDPLSKGMKALKFGPSPPKKKANLPPTTPRPLRPQTPVPVKEQKISIRANHYQVEIVAKNFPSIIHHYDVVIRNVEIPLKDPAQADEQAKRRAMQAKKAEKEGKEVAGLPDRMLPAIWKEFQRQFHSVLRFATPFDGKKNVYTARRLEFPNGDAFSADMHMDDPDDPDKKRKFRVEIKWVAGVDTSSVAEFMRSGKTFGEAVEQPQDVIQGLDVALRHAPASAYIPCNRSFFNPNPEKRHSLDALLELLHGHYQSLCLGADNTATLNIDLATKAFYKEMPLTDYIRIACAFPSHYGLELNEWEKKDMDLASEALKGKLIKYGTGPYNKATRTFTNYHKFTAVALVKETSTTYEFSMTDENKVTKRVNIQQYMAKKNTQIQHPEYPVVHIGNKHMTNYVPLELCTIITQPYRGKMEPKLTSAMIKGAAIAPMERFQSIEFARKGCHFESCRVLEEFGIKIGNTPIGLDAYKIKPPVIHNRKGGKIATADMHPSEGKWSFMPKDNNRDQRQYVIPAVVPKYMVLNCSSLPKETVDGFIDHLIIMGTQHGMTEMKQNRGKYFHLHQFGGKDLPPPQLLNPRRSDLGYKPESREVTSIRLQRAFAGAKKNEYEFVIVVMNQDGKEYPVIKTEAEVRIGILTACIRADNVMKHHTKPQTLMNYLLKLNSKLNGTNFTVSPLSEFYFKEPTMILGADVTHPSPNSTAPSIAAVTASFNMSGMGYTMHIQPQDSRQELIVNMAEIVEKNLKEFRKETGKLPKRLLMFRDGVSEGYFDEVKAIEHEQIRKICDEMVGTGEKIKITFVIVKKRHHTRFQPNNPNEGVGKFRNVPPGTVVDSKIVHPAEVEFFLNSHVGIQGTSKPTRYHVIHDDNSYSIGDLMRITYYLCYGFVRCTQPVSYPAATYYAHLAAYRARHLLEKEGENASLEALIRQLTIHPDLKKYPMFFV